MCGFIIRILGWGKFVSSMKHYFSAKVKDGQIEVDAKDVFKKSLKKHEGKDIVLKVYSAGSKALRTEKQNKAMHLYFTKVSEALNDAGYTVQATIPKYKMEIAWTPQMIKELMFRTAMKSMLKIESTTQLKRDEDINLVYDVMDRFLGELGVESIPFPFECKSCSGLSMHYPGCPDVLN